MSNREYESREINQNRNEDSSSFLLGAIIGGVVGAACALLFAPKSGKDIRNKISSNTGSIVNKTGKLGETMKNKGNELAAKTSSFSQEIVHQSSDLINKVKEKASNREATENKNEREIRFIPIGGTGKADSKKQESKGASDDEAIRKKLMEAQVAFDEEENRIKL
ncbi:YtxH domain-containing protein [Neobacillus mesonae]|uniref:YtxH domain-containing protein n=1 Tax=Neobacillus mesonae TaxID=1193713 RepID=UPI00203DEBE8|nr:YtxH domain-containing protein [Neobacillus mesonae]MCM3569633.1 YtxH domain-containing protein [Neobacillus mesonae]